MKLASEAKRSHTDRNTNQFLERLFVARIALSIRRKITCPLTHTRRPCRRSASQTKTRQAASIRTMKRALVALQEAMRTRPCEHCGNQVSYKQWARRRRYCNATSCRKKGIRTRTPRACDHCEKKFRPFMKWGAPQALQPILPANESPSPLGSSFGHLSHVRKGVHEI
jgi:hypothetical protein